MRWLALPLLFVGCHPVAAQDHDQEGFFVRPPEIQYLEDPEPGDDWFGRIVINNHEGSTGGGRHFETVHGRIRVDHVVTPNQPCYDDPTLSWEYCADLIYATTPQNILAWPDEVEPLEATQAVIYLFVQHVGS